MALVELSVVEQRYRAVLQVEAGVPVTEVAARFGVSRQSVHAWLRRYRAEGLAGLGDRSRRPESCPHQMSAEIEALVCELRLKHPRWGHPAVRQDLSHTNNESLLRHSLREPSAVPLGSRALVVMCVMGCQGRSCAPHLMSAASRRKRSIGRVMWGPLGSLLSRTPTAWGERASSTQSEVALPPLWLDLRQFIIDGSPVRPPTVPGTGRPGRLCR